MAFDGTWKVEKSENYDKFMEVMGVNIMKRKLAAHDNLKIIIEQSGDKFTVKESSTFRTIEIIFNLGVQFEYSLADGTELIGAWTMEGDKLVGNFNRKDNGKELKTRRELIGDELHQTYFYKFADNFKTLMMSDDGRVTYKTYLYEGVEAKRIFKRG